MHRHRILARFSLILSILNLVLAAPIVVKKLHEARLDEMVVAEDLASMLKKWRGVEASSDRLVLPRLPPDDPETASPQHSTSVDEPAASETDTLDSDHSRSLPLGPDPNPNPPASLHDSGFPRPSNSEPSLDIPSSSHGTGLPYPPSSASSDASQELEPEYIPQWWLDRLRSGPSERPEWLEQMQADLQPYLRHSWFSHGSASGPSDPGPSTIQRLRPLGWQVLEEGSTPLSPPESTLAFGSEAPHPERLPEFAPAPPFPPLRDESETSSRTSSSASSEIPEVSLPEQLQESAHAPAPPAQPILAGLESLPPSPGTSSSGSEITEIRLPERLQEFAPTPPAPPLPAGSTSPLELPRPSVPGSLEIPEMPLATWLQEFASAPERRPTPQPNEIDQVMTEAHLPPDQAPESLVPSHYLTPDEPPPSHSSPPTETPPDDRNFFNKEVMKNIGIPVAAAIVGGAMITAGVVGLGHYNHHQDR